MAKAMDIVFLVDNTGSMSGYIESVKNTITEFAGTLNNSGIDYQLGLVEFGDINDSSIKRYSFTTNIDDFVSNVNNISLTSGGAESGLEALVAPDNGALSMEGFRDNADKRFILVTDNSFHNFGEDGDGDSTTYLVTSDVQNQLTTNNVTLDVVGTPQYSQEEYEPLAEATGGHFYDISQLNSGLLTNLANEIIDDVNMVTVDLQTVADGETGVFVIKTETADDGIITLTNETEFKTAAEDGDTVVGNVTENKVYVAVSNISDTDTKIYSQNIIIPESWNVTATTKNDELDIIGNNATIGGGEGKDRFTVREGVNNVVFADFTPSDDYIELETHIEEKSLVKSTANNSLVLSGTMNMKFQDIPSLTDELENEIVSNGGQGNTIGQLISDYSPIWVNSDAPVQMSFSHWTYGFTPSES